MGSYVKTQNKQNQEFSSLSQAYFSLSRCRLPEWNSLPRYVHTRSPPVFPQLATPSYSLIFLVSSPPSAATSPPTHTIHPMSPQYKSYIRNSSFHRPFYTQLVHKIYPSHLSVLGDFFIATDATKETERGVSFRYNS